MKHTSELALKEQTTAVQAFSTEGGLDPIVQEAKDFVSGFEHDMSTGVARARTASLSAKVSKLKVRLDDMGKDLVSDWKAKAKRVDASRKKMREDLDALRDEARKPLTDWEAEQERIKAEKAAKDLADKIAIQLQTDHEIGLLMNEKIDRDAAEAKAEAERQRVAEQQRLEQERLQREEQIRRDAAEKARLDAEAAAKAERDRAEQERQDAVRREREANERAAQAERDRIAANQRAQEQEQERLRQEQQAKIDQAAAEARARQQEAERHQEEQRRIKEQQEARERNTQHKATINRQAVADLMFHARINESQARDVVKAIAKRTVRNVSVNY